jgi:DNA-binding SARP family transcriptional activator
MAHLVRQQSLLAYLVLHRHAPQTRRNLSFLFWPDASEVQARANLRKALYDLRKLLPKLDDFVQIDAQALQWCNRTETTLDVEQFAASLAQANQAEAQEARRAALEQAVALYTGDLLPACYDDWLLLERERLRQQYVTALEQLIGILEQQHELASALAYAQRLLHNDALHESTYRLLMRLHVRNGDRATALRIYHTCVTLLQQELGVEPSSETQQLYQRLLNAPSAPVVRPNDHLPATKRTGSLVGRQLEWKHLQSTWSAAASGSHTRPPHVVLVTGEAGIGKTRLIEELHDWVVRQGGATATARCYAAEGQLALAPVADWLRTDALRAALSALDETWLIEISRLLPELLVERPELPRPSPLTESGQRLRLFKALTQVVLAGSQPLLLAIDDLQWCDRETIEWLHYLLRCEPQRPLLLAASARPEAVGANHPLHALILYLRATEQVTEIELGPLNPQATAQLAGEVAGQDLNAEAATHLYAETEGNPLFVVEMVRGQWAHGVTDHDDLKPTPPAGALAQKVDAEYQYQPSVLPAKVHAIIQSHLAQLSPEARQLAELAATIGRSFTLSVIAKASDADEETLVRGLDELWQRRVIREQEADAYDFSHEKIREVAYGEISRVRQQHLHRRIAQALEAVHVVDLDVVSGRIAAHYEQAGLFEAAVRFYQRAAEMARRIYANREAKEKYSRAIEMSRRITPVADEAQLLPLYEGRALVCRSLTQLDEAIADFQVVRRIAQNTGNAQKEGESLCQLAYTHWLTFAEDQMPLVEQYAQEATGHFAQSGDQRILARSLTMLGAVDQVNRKIADAGHKLEEALSVSRKTGDKETLVQTLSFLCLQSYLQGNSQSTVDFAQEGVAVARNVQDDFNELRIQAFLCLGYWSAGSYAQAYDLAQEAMAQAKERGNKFVEGRLLNTLGWFHHEFGDFSGALAYDQRSAELGRTAHINNVEISASINIAYDYLALGQLSQAQAAFESMLERVQREGFGAHKWRWQMKLYMGLAEHALEAGAHAQALRYVEEALREALATSSQKYVAKGQALRGKILAQMGDREAAGAELRRAFSTAEALKIPSLFYPIAYALGEWHEMMGRQREAAAFYARTKETVAQMANAVGSEALASALLQSEQVRAISESWTRNL